MGSPIQQMFSPKAFFKKKQSPRTLIVFPRAMAYDGPSGTVRHLLKNQHNLPLFSIRNNPERLHDQF
jgi:hypothetical protein